MSVTVDQGAVTPFSATTAGTNAGAVASIAAVSGKIHIITSISGHTDTDSLIQILGGAAGATVVWESKIDISLQGFSFNFSGIWVEGVPGIKLEGKVATSTTDCQVNVSGYSIP